MVIGQEQLRFQHKVSRGSRYNQIYIPQEMKGLFEVGDIVEVRLIEKANTFALNVGNRLEINDFKKEIIRQIFSIASGFKEIEQVIIFGSFLTQKVDYNDIDIALVINGGDIEKKFKSTLIEKLPLKFHIISFKQEKLNELLEFCPLTRSMFYYNISNKKFEIPKKTKLNKEHLEFLLMMPEDLLKVHISNSRAYFDSVRRLITIIRFLKNEDLDSLKINSELKAIMGELYDWSKNKETLNEECYVKFRQIIEHKLKEVKKLLNGK